MNLTLTIDGIPQFDGAFNTLGKTIADWRPAWPEIEQVFYRIELEQFNTEGARGGERWAPLTANYGKWKEAHFPGQPILVRTGRLRRSLSVLGTGDSIREREAQSLTLGTRVPYAGFHQYGSGRRRRQPLQITRNDIGKFISRLYRYAERGARDAGFGTQGRLATAGEFF